MTAAPQLTAPAPADTEARQEAAKAPEVTATQPAPQLVALPNSGSTAATPPVAVLPQRRLSAAERRRKQRDRAADYRARKSAQRAEHEQAHAAERAAEQAKADAERAQAAAMTAAAEKVAREQLDKKEDMVRDAIGGTVEAVADTVHLVWLDKHDPRIGEDRCKTIGELWAPIIAPYINEKTAKALLIVMASGGTASAFYGWAHEVQKLRAERSK